MKKSEIYKLLDILDDVKRIDAIILTHKNSNDSNFMISQYESKKTKLIGTLIDVLISPEIQSAQSFDLIERILCKYYPAKIGVSVKYDTDMEMLLAAI